MTERSPVASTSEHRTASSHTINQRVDTATEVSNPRAILSEYPKLRISERNLPKWEALLRSPRFQQRIKERKKATQAEEERKVQLAKKKEIISPSIPSKTKVREHPTKKSTGEPISEAQLYREGRRAYAFAYYSSRKQGVPKEQAMLHSADASQEKRQELLDNARPVVRKNFVTVLSNRARGFTKGME